MGASTIHWLRQNNGENDTFEVLVFNGNMSTELLDMWQRACRGHEPNDGPGELGHLGGRGRGRVEYVVVGGGWADWNKRAPRKARGGPDAGVLV